MNMKALIIEDEFLAQMSLESAINQYIPDVEVVGKIDSVEKAILWFSNPDNKVDIAFMDVELSDGMCFNIFDEVKIDAQVIITTAYDTYAIKAFKICSVDYLLKPIDTNELIIAVNRCRENRNNKKQIDYDTLLSAFNSMRTVPVNQYKERFSVRLGDKIVIIQMSNVAYLYSEDKTNYVVMKDARKYIIDASLNEISETLNPSDFFRLSRSVVASVGAIQKVMRYSNSRIKVILEPAHDFEIFVGRFKVNSFLRWIDGL